MGAIVCLITKSAILISAQFNISPHYSFMVQNQITVSLCLTVTICLVLHTIHRVSKNAPTLKRYSWKL